MHWVKSGDLGIEMREDAAATRSRRTEQNLRCRKEKGEAFFLDSG